MDTFPATLLALAITAPILVGLILLAGRDLPRSFASGFAFGGFAIPAVLGPWLLVLWSNPSTTPAQFQSEGFWGFGFALNPSPKASGVSASRSTASARRSSR